LPGAVVALGFTSFFTDVGSEMIFPLLPAFLVSLGAAPLFLGLLEGLAEATSSLLKLASGYVADWLPRKKPLVVAGYVIAGLARPLMALATVPAHVLAVRLGDRVGKGIRTSPRDALLAAAASETQVGRAFGFHRAMDHAGAVVGPLVASALLAGGASLRGVFWLALVPGMLALSCLAFVRERPAAPPVPVSAAPPERSGTALPSAFRWYLLIVVLFALGNASDAFLLLRAQELGVSAAAIPLLWAAFHVSKVLSSFLGGSWSDRFGRARLMIAGWLVYAACYVAFGFATQPWQAWALFLVYGTFYGLTEPSEKAVVRALVAPHALGRAYGYFNCAVGLSAVPAGLLTGYVWQTWSARAALLLGACTGALACMSLFAWSRRWRALGSLRI
jgi:MFS family permease